MKHISESIIGRRGNGCRYATLGYRDDLILSANAIEPIGNEPTNSKPLPKGIVLISWDNEGIYPIPTGCSTENELKRKITSEYDALKSTSMEDICNLMCMEWKVGAEWFELPLWCVVEYFRDEWEDMMNIEVTDPLSIWVNGSELYDNILAWIKDTPYQFSPETETFWSIIDTNAGKIIAQSKDGRIKIEK